MNYKDLISHRKSVRNYKNTKVSNKDLSSIINYSKKCKILDPNIDYELLIKDKDEAFDVLKGNAGYLGNMIEAPHYILILSETKQHHIENAGYIGEQLVLKALDLGIDSCWITFKDSDLIKEKLNINTTKAVCALISLGYDANKTKIINTIKTGENYSKCNINVVDDNVSSRLDIEDIVYINEWGNCANLSDLATRSLLEAFYYTSLAPSTLNRQPWRFIIDDNIIVLFSRDDPNTNIYEEKIDAGISMLYFELIVDQTIFDLTWILKEPDKKYSFPENYKIFGYCNI